MIKNVLLKCLYVILKFCFSQACLEKMNRIHEHACSLLLTFWKMLSILEEIELKVMSVLDSSEKPFIRVVSVLEGNEINFVSVLASLEKTLCKGRERVHKNELKFTSVLICLEKHFERFHL